MIAYFILAGQSNMDQWFHAGDGAALAAFKETFLTLNPQYTDVQFFDAARGGSAMLEGSALEYADDRASDDPDLYDRIAENYWYNETTGEAGPNLVGFIEDIEAAVDEGIVFSGIIWSQGEADTTYVGANGADDYAEGLQFVLDELMQASGAPHVYIQALGDRSFFSQTLHGGSAAIRDAQQKIADQSDAITIATTIFDLDLRDSVHLTVEGYEAAGVRMAIAISTGETSPAIGEVILVDPNTILIQIDLARDQQFSGIIDLGGFSLVENGEEVQISHVEISASGLLRIETLTYLSNPSIAYGAVEQSVDMQASDFIYVTGPNGTVPVLPFNVTVTAPELETTELTNGLRITSGTLSDTIIGQSGDDYLFGNGGDDVLIGGWGRDRLYGGSGSDTFVLSDDQSTDIVYDFNLAEDAIGLNGITISDVSFRAYGANDLDIRTADGQRIVLRNVSYDARDDVRFNMLGTDGANILTGGEGNDFILAGNGNDEVNSGAGEDWISLGLGSDTVSFGTGSGSNTIADFDVTQDTVALLNLGASSLVVSETAMGDLELQTPGGDRLVLEGVSIADFDAITFDDLRPEVGFLIGTEGNDTLNGSKINDYVESFGGTDRLYGGGGNDVFVFGAGSGLNVIYDFADGEDRILIEGGSFGDVTLIAYNATDAEVRLDSGDRLVLRNVDLATLDADDFIFTTPAEFL